MGFYLRKPVKAGPFRFNISKSGIGVSGGVKGLRVGSGPRGNYVHMGRHGVYYRKTLGSGSGRSSARTATPVPTPAPTEVGLPMESLTGATTEELAQSSSSELLRQIQEAEKRIRLWPIVLGVTLLFGLANLGVELWLGALILVIGLAATFWAWVRDKARKTIVIFYEVEGEPAARFDALVEAFQSAARSQKAWHMTAAAAVSDLQTHKRSAGASQIVQREEASLSMSGPAVIASNITIPTLKSKTRSVFLLPDRLLILQGGQYADVAWDSVSATADESRFIEDGPVPSDAQVVDHTWQYVNKSGGPDRRYKDNRELPICLYGELLVSGSSGLRAEWQFSRTEAVKELPDAIGSMTTPEPVA